MPARAHRAFTHAVAIVALLGALHFADRLAFGLQMQARQAQLTGEN